MTTVLALIGALSLASIPLVLGWRGTTDIVQNAIAFGIAPPKERFDPEKFALQTGTGLTFNQMVFGFLAWVIGGFLSGLMLGPVAAVLFAIAGGLLYAGTLTSKRETFRLNQARDILRGLGVIQTLLEQGQPLIIAIEEAARAVGPHGQMVLGDLVVRMRSAAAHEMAKAVREWANAWSNPAVDIVGTTLLASLEGRIEIGPLVASLRSTLNTIVEVLSRARAAAKGIEWQARFLALFPPSILVILAIVTPEMGRLYATRPWYLLPVLFGSGISYALSTRMIRQGLSIEASMGLHTGSGKRAIILDRMGRVK